MKAMKVMMAMKAMQAMKERFMLLRMLVEKYEEWRAPHSEQVDVCALARPFSLEVHNARPSCMLQLTCSHHACTHPLNVFSALADLAWYSQLHKPRRRVLHTPR